MMDCTCNCDGGNK